MDNKKNLQALFTLPVLTQHIPYQVTDSWIKAFKYTVSLPKDLPTYTGSNRLGFYYQWLWKQSLQHNHQYTLIAEEIQIQQDKQTIGAIDFLIYNNRTHQLEHWEVAIKYYLEYGGLWVGSQIHDELTKKTNRMIQHQLQLTATQTYQNNYERQWGKIEKRRLILQGMIFRSQTSSNHDKKLLSPLNPRVPKGQWIHAKEIRNKKLKPLTKLEWLNPPLFSEIPTTTLTPTDIIKSVQAVDLKENRWFILPNNWPNQA